MAITIPDVTKIRQCTGFDEPQNGRAMPAMKVSKNAGATLRTGGTGISNPGPVIVDSDTTAQGTAGAPAQAAVIQAGGGNGTAGYVGYNPDPDIPVGEPISPVMGVLYDGFAGVVAGSDVFIDQSNTADAGATNSGLTHTQPTQAVTITNPGAGETATVPGGRRIGIGWSTTKIFFF